MNPDCPELGRNLMLKRLADANSSFSSEGQPRSQHVRQSYVGSGRENCAVSADISGEDLMT
jgi:hypothetical protein